MMDIISIIGATFAPTISKILASAGLFILFLVGPLYHDAIVAVIMLMIIDTILGITAVVYEGKPITSRRFSRVLHKGIVYLMSISAGHFVDLTLPVPLAQSTMIGFIAVTEFISILENMGRMGYHTPKKLLNQLKDFQSSK
jgi:phage-related holin